MVRIFLFIAISYYLWQGLVTNQQIVWDLGEFTLPTSTTSYLLLGLTLLLLPANWLLEAKKWQIIAFNTGISLFESLRGVILGLTLDNVLPFGTGSISGRLVTLKKEQRYSTVPGILAGQLAQSVVTFLFGLIGFGMVWRLAPERFFIDQSVTLILVALGLVTVIGLYLYKRQIIKFLQPLKSYPLNSWVLISALSLARYMVFLLQFILLASFFITEFNVVVIFGAATWVFAARTFMPKVTNLERLGIRALAVIFFCEIFALSPTGLLLTVISLWLINLVIPSLVGLGLLSKMDRKDVF